MSLSTLHLDKEGSQLPFPINLVDALKILKHDRTPSINPQHHRQESLKTHPQVNFPPKSKVEERVQRPKDKVNTDEILTFRKLNTFRKPSKNVQPLGRIPACRSDPNLDFIPNLRKLDMEIEKERELQRVMNNLKLGTKNAHHRTATTSSKNKESVVGSRSGMDFTSAMIEGHNFTLKQLRDFWSEMPSFLSIQAASLKSKYGVLEKDGTDIDDISIEIVKKWNQPTTPLPHINKPRDLYIVQEETL